MPGFCHVQKTMFESEQLALERCESTIGRLPYSAIGRLPYSAIGTQS